MAQKIPGFHFESKQRKGNLFAVVRRERIFLSVCEADKFPYPASRDRGKWAKCATGELRVIRPSP